MHNILGIVKVVIGQVFAIAVDGTQRELHEGDRIFVGEEIVTSANGALTVNLSDGHTMDMGRNSHWSDQRGLSAAANTEHATDDVAALQQAITDGVDPTKALDATAAGNEAPIEAGTGGGGHFIEHVELTGEVVDATSGFATNSLGSPVLDSNQFDTFPVTPGGFQGASTTTETELPILTPTEIAIGTQTPVEILHAEQPPVEALHLDKPAEILATELTPAEIPHTEQPPVETPHLDIPSVAPTEVPLTTVTTAETPLTTVAPTDVPLTTVTTAEIPLTTVAPIEVPLTTVTTAEIPMTTVAPTDVPLTTVTTAETPLTTVAPIEVPLTTVTTAEIPMTTVAPTDVPLTTVTTAEIPLTTVAPTDVPLTTVTTAETPLTTVAPTDVTLTTVTTAEIPLTTVAPTDVPLTTVTTAETPLTTVAPTDVTLTTVTTAETPLTTVAPTDVTLTTVTPAEIPMTTLTPADPNHQVTITIDSIETEETPSTDQPTSGITHVNGGTESPDGFDIQDGKIVSIGSNVRVYLSEGDLEPQCADPEHQIQHYNDGNQKGDGNYSDIFVVHPGSQYRQGDGTYHDLHALDGNTQSEQNGHKDYVFVQDGKDTDYQIGYGTNNNSQTNVNTQENVSVSGSDGMGHTLQLQGINHIEGVILGDGTVHTQNEGSTSVESGTPVEKPGEQHSTITGSVSGDAALGDIVKLTVNDHHYKGAVVDLGDGHKGYHILVEPGDLKTGESVHVSITVKDEAGHYTTATAEHDVSDDQVPRAIPSDAPVVTEPQTFTPELHSQITHVNGGSESAEGFDIQDGKIVSIGSNVNVWLSEGDSEPKCDDPQNQIKHYNNGNVNGDGSHADVFVVHEGSGYLQDGNHRSLDAINGTTQQLQGGHKDYVFVQDGKEADLAFSFSSNNNATGNVNTLDNVSVTGPVGQGLHLQGMNHLEGVIYGDGTVHSPNEGRTSISHSDAPVSDVEHSLPPAAPPPAPLVEESAVHAVVEHHAEQPHSLNNLLESNDDLFLPAPALSADNAINHSGSPDQGDDRINLSDLAQELEHGTDITSLIKGNEHSASEPAVIDTKAHAVPAMMSESAGMDSLQHSSFDHLLHNPEHQY